MTFSPAEQRAFFAILLHAALANGAKSDVERASLKQMTTGLVAPDFNPWIVYQDVLAGRYPVEAAVRDLPGREARLLVYEMALGVCDTDGPADAAERNFLAGLRTTLGLAEASAPEAGALGQAEHDAEAVAAALPGDERSASATTVENASVSATAAAAAPALGGASAVTGAAATDATRGPAPHAAGAAQPPVQPDVPAVEKSILNHAILCGALELMPQSLATMAVVPLQMKLVYGVGKAHGYTLDRGHLRDFLATAGLGLASQAVEGYARKLVGGLLGAALGRGVIGGLARGAARTGTGAVMTFASTYAIGQLALRYYGGGRRMETAVIKDTFQKLLGQGRELFGQHQGAVEARAATLRPGDVIDLVRAP
jgi:uncharacterized protein (DUF697 family)